MEDQHHATSDPGASESTPGGRRPVSRRDFLKGATLAGVAVGAGGGLGAVLAACGSATTTTSSSAATGTAGSSTTAAPSSGTSTSAPVAPTTAVTAGAEIGREVKLGYVSPQTGALATFGIPDKYCVDRVKEFIADGVVLGDAKKHPISIIVRDTQSDSNRAGQVTGDLIQNDQVDMMLASSTDNTVLPASIQCEAAGVPCIASDIPAPAWFFGLKGDPKTPFKWIYLAFWSSEPVVTTFLDLWDQVPTNKVVGMMLPNSNTGNAWRGVWPPLFQAQGLKVVDGGAFPEGTEDYSSIIAMFKKEGVQIVAAVMNSPDYVNFTKQSAQQGFVPVVDTGGEAMLFPESAEAIGPPALGVTCEQWWSPSFPFKSSLTGETCQQFADEFTNRTNRQWTQPLMHYLVFELGIDALKRTQNLDDKAAISQAIASTKMADTLGGPIDFSAPVVAGGKRPFPNVCATPLVGGQWVKGEKFPYEIKICSNKADPTIPIQVQEKPLASFKS
jgi:branched-chain amino acid transport system substrate-binding protein